MAEANGIQYSPRECGYLGECSGTCPFCEKEAADLLTLLKKKEAQGCEILSDEKTIQLFNEIGHVRSIVDVSHQRQEEQRLVVEQILPLMGDVTVPNDMLVKSLSVEEQICFNRVIDELMEAYDE